MKIVLIILLGMALNGCVACGPLFGHKDAKDMIHGFCTEF